MAKKPQKSAKAKAAVPSKSVAKATGKSAKKPDEKTPAKAALKSSSKTAAAPKQTKAVGADLAKTKTGKGRESTQPAMMRGGSQAHDPDVSEVATSSSEPAKAGKPPKAAKVSAKAAKVAAAEKAAARVLGEAQAEDVKKWNEYKSKFGGTAAPTYSMSGQFEAQGPLQHKTLGWGYIVSINNDRLEVLFESGRKTLISNYKFSGS